MIKSIHLFADGMCSAKIVAADGSEIEITLTKEGLQGKSMDERYAAVSARANALLACGLDITEVADYSDAFHNKTFYKTLSGIYRATQTLNAEVTAPRAGAYDVIISIDNVYFMTCEYFTITEWEVDRSTFEKLYKTTIYERSPQV